MNTMTHDEYMVAYRRNHEGLNPGGAEMCERLIPGMLAIGHAVLNCLVGAGNTNAERVRTISDAALRRTLASKTPRFSMLRDDLAVLCWHELACRGEDYMPRGVVEVAHAWALMLDGARQ